jgi:hypothetical protein
MRFFKQYPERNPGLAFGMAGKQRAEINCLGMVVSRILFYGFRADQKVKDIWGKG